MSIRSITTNQYKLLARECDKLILGDNEDKDQRGAINFLHVIRESQTTLERYNLIFEVDNDFLLNLNSFYRLIKYTSLMIYNLLKSLFYTRQIITNSKSTPIDYLLIGHYIGKRTTKNEFSDAYFGGLVNKLQQDGKHSATALINHTNDSGVFLKNENLSTPIFVLSNSLGFFKVFSIYKKLYSTFFSIKNVGDSVLSSRIATRAKIESLSSSTLRNIIIASQVKDLISEYNPKCIITTYEGHAWERLVFYSSRNINPNIQNKKVTHHYT